MKIQQVELLSADLKSTEHFYSNQLQLKLFRKSETALYYIAGSSLLIFILTTTLKPVYHLAFEIPCNQLQQAIHWLSQHIELISSEDNSVIVDFDNWNAKSVYFYDDNQNILEFIIRFDNDVKSNDTFDASSILNISEVGLVNADVIPFAEELKSICNLQYYDKQPPRENFCALGNAEGLFVISGNERNWFPTNMKAMKYPVYVKFEEKGNFYELNYK